MAKKCSDLIQTIKEYAAIFDGIELAKMDAHPIHKTGIDHLSSTISKSKE